MMPSSGCGIFIQTYLYLQILFGSDLGEGMDGACGTHGEFYCRTDPERKRHRSEDSNKVDGMVSIRLNWLGIGGTGGVL